MLTLLLPCTIRRPIPDLTQNVDRFLFAQVFRENNSWVRTSFFSDPLVKYLWEKIFLEESPEIVIAHLRRLRSDENGAAKQDRLMKDMFQIEMELGIKLLPDIAKDPKNLTAFS